MNKPYVGMPVSIAIGSDQYAATIISLTKSLKTLIVEHHDNALKNYGKLKFTLRKHGKYVQSETNYIFLRLGNAVTKLDEGF